MPTRPMPRRHRRPGTFFTALAVLAPMMVLPAASAGPTDSLPPWLDEAETLSWEYVHGFDPTAPPEEQRDDLIAFVTALQSLAPIDSLCGAITRYSFQPTAMIHGHAEVRQNLDLNRISVKVTVSPSPGLSPGGFIGITTIELGIHGVFYCGEDLIDRVVETG